MKPYAFGVDIGGTSIKIGLAKTSGWLFETRKIGTPIDLSAESFLLNISEVIKQRIHARGLRGSMALTSPQTQRPTGRTGDSSPLQPAGLMGLVPWKEKGRVSLTPLCSAYAHFRGSVKWFHGDSPRITPQGTWADHCFVDYTIITALLQSSLGFILRLCRGLFHPFADGPRRPCLFSPCERGAVEV